MGYLVEAIRGYIYNTILFLSLFHENQQWRQLFFLLVY